MKCLIHPICRVSYEESIQAQSEAFIRVRESKVPELLFFEYPQTTVTYGRRMKREDFSGLPKSILLSSTERGGLATLHNPGQLVCYPVVPLREYNFSVKSYVCFLEKCVQRLVESYGVEAFLEAGRPGVYTSKGKISSLGIRVENGISTHGVSINIENDLSEFSWIQACGYNQKIARLKDFDPSISLDQVFLRFCEQLQKEFT